MKMHLCLCSIQKKIAFVVYVIEIMFIIGITAQLQINVQNQGGEIVQETIISNVDDDTITLEFQRTDGTLITLLLDFRNEVQMLKALVLGEEERGQSQYQVMCFITKFAKNEFISSDAMAKLRQKNPSTIRQPEEDRGRENYTMTGWINLARSAPISRHISGLCSEASDSTYVRDSDIQSWATILGSSLASLEAAKHPFPTSIASRCNNVSGLWSPCTCSLEMCIGWYPCGLKFCKGKTEINSNGINDNNISYRCGIKTCRKCNQFSYYVRQKQQCLWDD